MAVVDTKPTTKTTYSYRRPSRASAATTTIAKPTGAGWPMLLPVGRVLLLLLAPVLSFGDDIEVSVLVRWRLFPSGEAVATNEYLSRHR